VSSSFDVIAQGNCSDINPDGRKSAFEPVSRQLGSRGMTTAIEMAVEAQVHLNDLEILFPSQREKLLLDLAGKL
jgi:hypothetical protein